MQWATSFALFVPTYVPNFGVWKIGRALQKIEKICELISLPIHGQAVEFTLEGGTELNRSNRSLKSNQKFHDSYHRFLVLFHKGKRQLRL